MLSGLIESMPNPIFVKDEGRRRVMLNEGYCKLLGYPREQLLGKTDHELFPKADADAISSKDDALFRLGGISESEERFTGAGGRVHVLLERKRLHVEPDGSRFLLGVLTDITERTNVEGALEASETRYRRLFEAAKDGILILDAETGKIVDVNPFLLELTGYARKDFLGLISGKSARSRTGSSPRPRSPTCRPGSTYATRTCRCWGATAGRSRSSSSATCTASTSRT
jgi:PAS domain S-box-containing protein